MNERVKQDEKIEEFIYLFFKYFFKLTFNALYLTCNCFIQGTKHTININKAIITLQSLLLCILAFLIVKFQMKIEFLICIPLICVFFRGLIFKLECIRLNNALLRLEVTSKALNIKSIKYEGLRRKYVIKTSIPSTKFKMHLSKINKMVNSSIVNIESITKKRRFFQNTDRRFIIITTDKKESPEVLKREEKFLSVFSSLKVEVDIKKYEDNEYNTNLYFNTDLFYNKLISLKQEISHKLKVNNVEIVTDSFFDYKLTVHKRKENVQTFLQAWDSLKERAKKLVIPALIGTNCETGKYTMLDLSKDVVHGVVAGSSGWGKSVELHNIISSIVLANRKNVELVLCDPKINELKCYRNLNNVTYANTDTSILSRIENVVKEVDRRNKLFEQSDTIVDIVDYNHNNHNKMNFIVVVIDEIADFMLKSDKKVKSRFESLVTRLAQVGRSAGIVLLLTTQNPVISVLTSNIQANCSTKFGFTTVDKQKSRTILDDNICSEINEKGKFAFKNKNSIVLHKSFFIPQNEKIEIISRVKNKGEEIENIVIDKNTGLRERIEAQGEKGENVVIHNHYNLYAFYVERQKDGGLLPLKKMILDETGLSEWKLRQFNDQLKKEKKIITENNKLYIVDELKARRQRK
jgi:hypothetical protein